MRSLVFALLFILCNTAAFSQVRDSGETPIAITHVTVIPMDSERVLEDQTVIIKGDRILEIGPALKLPKNSFVVDGRGKFLIPGLAEMHAHVPPIDDLQPMKDVLLLFALNGITTIRGMLGHPKHLELRDKLKNSELTGPQLFTTGPSFNGMSITSPEAGSNKVRQQKVAGYDYLKLHPGLSRAKFDSIAATAQRVGIPFVGHVSSGVGVWRAIEAGYSSIDHLDGFVEALVPGIEKISDQERGPFALFVASQADTTKIPALIEALKKSKTWVVPTQSLAERWFSAEYDPESFRLDPTSRYMDRKTVDQWIASKENIQKSPLYDKNEAKYFVELRRKLIKACNDNGIGLLLGCDAPQVFNVPGFSTHEELFFLVGSGLTPYEALKTGTINVARYLKRPDSGVLRKGAIADLILLNKNPLSDIRNTRSIEGVMLQGKWLSGDHIDSELRRLIKQ